MKALILAAGRGARLRPLTDHTVKPLLPIAGKPLIMHHLEHLASAGITDVVINLAYKADQLQHALGDGSAFGVNITYSDETDGALGTGGAITHALHHFSDQPFCVINGDIWTDYPLEQLTPPSKTLAHLVLVNKPDYEPRGDFDLNDGLITTDKPHYTFSGISLYQPEFFADIQPGNFSILPVWQDAISRQQLSGEVYQGTWFDIGTPERYAHCNAAINSL